MASGSRRYDGDSFYSLASVQFLARSRAIHFTRKALVDEAPLILPKSIVDVAGAIRSVVMGLEREQWRFCEEDEKGWVDVYRVLKYNRLLWVKIKIEQRFSKDKVIVISFHEWDDTIPI
jgi:hypothetical protein